MFVMQIYTEGEWTFAQSFVNQEDAKRAAKWFAKNNRGCDARLVTDDGEVRVVYANKDI